MLESSTLSTGAAEKPEYNDVELPPSIEIRESSVSAGKPGAFCKTLIKKDTKFGPYKGEVIKPSDKIDIDYRYSWEVIDKKKNLLKFIISAIDPKKSNWMRNVNCARFYEEQNIVSLQEGLSIFYVAMKDIKVGEELLTWFDSDIVKRSKKRVSRGERKKVGYTIELVPWSDEKKFTPEVIETKRNRKKKVLGEDMLCFQEDAALMQSSLNSMFRLPRNPGMQSNRQARRKSANRPAPRPVVHQISPPSAQLMSSSSAQFGYGTSCSLVNKAIPRLGVHQVSSSSAQIGYGISSSPAQSRNGISSFPLQSGCATSPSPVRGVQGVLPSQMNNVQPILSTPQHSMNVGGLTPRPKSDFSSAPNQTMSTTGSLTNGATVLWTMSEVVGCGIKKEDPFTETDENLQKMKHKREVDALRKRRERARGRPRKQRNSTDPSKDKNESFNPKNLELLKPVIIRTKENGSTEMEDHDEIYSIPSATAIGQDCDDSCQCVDKQGLLEQQNLSSSSSSIEKRDNNFIVSFILLPEHQTVTQNNKIIYKCDICGSSYNHAFSLKRHYLGIHINLRYLTQDDIKSYQLGSFQNKSSNPSFNVADVSKNSSENASICEFGGKVKEEVATNSPDSYKENNNSESSKLNQQDGVNNLICYETLGDLNNDDVQEVPPLKTLARSKLTGDQQAIIKDSLLAEKSKNDCHQQVESQVPKDLKPDDHVSCDTNGDVNSNEQADQKELVEKDNQPSEMEKEKIDTAVNSQIPTKNVQKEIEQGHLTTPMEVEIIKTDIEEHQKPCLDISNEKDVGMKEQSDIADCGEIRNQCEENEVKESVAKTENRNEEQELNTIPEQSGERGNDDLPEMTSGMNTEVNSQTQSRAQSESNLLNVLKANTTSGQEFLKSTPAVSSENVTLSQPPILCSKPSVVISPSNGDPIVSDLSHANSMSRDVPEPSLNHTSPTTASSQHCPITSHDNLKLTASSISTASSGTSCEADSQETTVHTDRQTRPVLSSHKESELYKHLIKLEPVEQSAGMSIRGTEVPQFIKSEPVEPTTVLPSPMKSEPMEVPVDLYRCHMCVLVYKSMEELKFHIQNDPHRFRGGFKQYGCPKCSVRFRTKVNLARHMTLQHQTAEEKEKTFRCETCGKGFDSETYMKMHSRFHLGKSFPCKYGCVDTFFPNAGTLVKHLRAVHPGLNLKEYLREKRLREKRVRLGLPPDLEGYNKDNPGIGFQAKREVPTNYQTFVKQENVLFTVKKTQPTHPSFQNNRTVPTIHALTSQAWYKKLGESKSYQHASMERHRYRGSVYYPQTRESTRENTNRPATSARRFRCKKCSATFQSYLYLLKHQSRRHGASQSVQEFLHQMGQDGEGYKFPEEKDLDFSPPPSPKSFFSNVNQRGRENMSKYIEGGAEMLRIRQKLSSSSDTSKTSFPPSPRMEWTSFNFPPCFKYARDCTKLYATAITNRDDSAGAVTGSDSSVDKENRYNQDMLKDISVSEGAKEKMTGDVKMKSDVGIAKDETEMKSESVDMICKGIINNALNIPDAQEESERSEIGIKDSNSLNMEDNKETEEENHKVVSVTTPNISPNQFTEVKVEAHLVIRRLNKFSIQALSLEIGSKYLDLYKSLTEVTPLDPLNLFVCETGEKLYRKSLAVRKTRERFASCSQATPKRSNRSRQITLEDESDFDLIKHETRRYSIWQGPHYHKSDTAKASEKFCCPVVEIVRKHSDMQKRKELTKRNDSDRVELKPQQKVKEEYAASFGLMSRAKFDQSYHALDTTERHIKPPEIWERYNRIWFGKKGTISVVCSICHRHFSCYELCLRHQLKKHPHIEPSSLEMEKNNYVEDMFYYYPMPYGILAQTRLLPENMPLPEVFVCSRCKFPFKTISKLHSHLVSCDPLNSYSQPKSQTPILAGVVQTPVIAELDKRKNETTNERLMKISARQDELLNKYKMLQKLPTPSLSGMPPPSTTLDVKPVVKPVAPVAGPKFDDFVMFPPVARRSRNTYGPLYDPSNHTRRREQCRVLDQHQCLGCHLKFRSMSMLERHLKKCTERDKLKNQKPLLSGPGIADETAVRKQHTCRYCNKRFTFIKGVDLHYKRICSVRKIKEEENQLTEEDLAHEAELQKIIEHLKWSKSLNQDSSDIIQGRVKVEEDGSLTRVEKKRGRPFGKRTSRVGRRKKFRWSTLKHQQIGEGENSTPDGNVDPMAAAEDDTEKESDEKKKVEDESISQMTKSFKELSGIYGSQSGTAPPSSIKRGRGRPSKASRGETSLGFIPARRRGRPRKNISAPTPRHVERNRMVQSLKDSVDFKRGEASNKVSSRREQSTFRNPKSVEVNKSGFSNSVVSRSSRTSKTVSQNREQSCEMVKGSEDKVNDAQQQPIIRKRGRPKKFDPSDLESSYKKKRKTDPGYVPIVRRTNTNKMELTSSPVSASVPEAQGRTRNRSSSSRQEQPVEEDCSAAAVKRTRHNERLAFQQVEAAAPTPTTKSSRGEQLREMSESFSRSAQLNENTESNVSSGLTRKRSATKLSNQETEDQAAESSLDKKMENDNTEAMQLCQSTDTKKEPDRRFRKSGKTEVSRKRTLEVTPDSCSVAKKVNLDKEKQELTKEKESPIEKLALDSNPCKLEADTKAVQKERICEKNLELEPSVEKPEKSQNSSEDNSSEKQSTKSHTHTDSEMKISIKETQKVDMPRTKSESSTKQTDTSPNDKHSDAKGPRNESQQHSPLPEDGNKNQQNCQPVAVKTPLKKNQQALLQKNSAKLLSKTDSQCVSALKAPEKKTPQKVLLKEDSCKKVSKSPSHTQMEVKTIVKGTIPSAKSVNKSPCSKSQSHSLSKVKETVQDTKTPSLPAQSPVAVQLIALPGSGAQSMASFVPVKVIQSPEHYSNPSIPLSVSLSPSQAISGMVSPPINGMVSPPMKFTVTQSPFTKKIPGSSVTTTAPQQLSPQMKSPQSSNLQTRLIPVAIPPRFLLQSPPRVLTPTSQGLKAVPLANTGGAVRHMTPSTVLLSSGKLVTVARPLKAVTSATNTNTLDASKMVGLGNVMSASQVNAAKTGVAQPVPAGLVRAPCGSKGQTVLVSPSLSTHQAATFPRPLYYVQTSQGKQILVNKPLPGIQPGNSSVLLNVGNKSGKAVCPKSLSQVQLIPMTMLQTSSQVQPSPDSQNNPQTENATASMESMEENGSQKSEDVL